MSSFSRVLRHHRRAAGLTQEELAERAQLSTRAISDLERGIKTAPRRETVELLAQALGLPLEELERAVPRRRGPRDTRIAEPLPTDPTPLVGREMEVRQVAGLLRQNGVRLLTVTGPAGIGKTRVALSVARALADEYSDDVRFVPLASLRNPSLVPSSLAQSLRIQRAGAETEQQDVIDELRGRRMLLVIDNFEHLLEAGSLLAELVTACPRLKLLITSRAALHLRGEHRFELGPLALPPPDYLPSIDEIACYPALALFAQRAQAVNPRFRMTPSNLAAIAGICQRLDGLPLAIELAAARANVLPPDALLRRLGSRLQVLIDGARDLPERHRTLRSAIAWSYELLTSQEQRLFRRLAIFVGSFSLEAAETIAGVDDDDCGDVLRGLTSLVNHSLLRTVASESDDARFAMLETIREFGLECLAASDEWDAISRRHCEYYVSLAESGYREQVGTRQAHWFRRLELEQGNLRAAARWIVARSDAGRASRLGLSLWRFWDRGHITEGRSWLDAFLGMPGVAEPGLERCRLLFAAGRLAYRQADYTAAETLLKECLDCARARQDDDFTASALTQLGHLAYKQWDLDLADRHYAEGLAIRRRVEDDGRTIGISLIGMARVQRARGDYAAARALLRESLDRFQSVEDIVQIAHAAEGLGLIALLEGKYAEASTWYEESLARSTEVGARLTIATALVGLALAAIGRGEPERAEELLKQSLALATTSGGRQLLAQSLEGFAALLAARGDARRSWRLAAAVAAYRERIKVPQDPSERALLATLLRPAAMALTIEERAALWATGRELTLEQAVAEAEQPALPDLHDPTTPNLIPIET